MSELHVWHDNDCVWVVAESARDAAIAYAQWCGYDDPEATIDTPGSDIMTEHWRMMPDDSPMRIIVGDDGDPKETRTCAEWAKYNGRGFLCTTER
jgi:hypothetical protein